jgi:hypothetical protein
MDDETRAELKSITDEVVALMDDVESALDEHSPHSYRLETRVRVESVGARYRAIVAKLNDSERLDLDKRVGRKLNDVQKMAMSLPAPPQGQKAAPRASTDFFETREGKSSNQPRVIGAATGQSPRAPRPKYKVTGDVDAWCGPCGEMRVHTIVAMVGEDPAQVVCQTCNSRHKYRTEPARGAKKDDGGAGAKSRSSGGGGGGASTSSMDAKNAFINELRMATNVRPFQPRDRYKAGEIIEHPEHGRGKIENVLPNSLLVRFSTGLKPVRLT